MASRPPDAGCGTAQKMDHLRALKWRIVSLSTYSYAYIPPLSLMERDPKIEESYTSLINVERDVPGIFDGLAAPSGKRSGKRVMRSGPSKAGNGKGNWSMGQRKRRHLKALKWTIQSLPNQEYRYTPPGSLRSQDLKIEESYRSLSKVERDLPGIFDDLTSVPGKGSGARIKSSGEAQDIFDPVNEAAKMGESGAVSDPEATDTDEAEIGSVSSETESDAPYDSAADEQVSSVNFPHGSNQQVVIDVGGSCDEDDDSDMDSDEDGRGKQQQRQQVQHKRKMRESEKEANELMEMSHSRLLKKIKVNDALLKKVKESEQKVNELMSQSYARMSTKIVQCEARAEEMARCQLAMIDMMRKTDARAQHLKGSITGLKQLVVESEADFDQVMLKHTSMLERIEAAKARAASLEAENLK
ncbi:unnamed protein product [Chrysoparadoxa australica]